MAIATLGGGTFAQQVEQPSQLPGITVQQQILLKNPLTLAVEGFRKVYTDAMPQPGSIGNFALSPDGRQMAFAFVYYGFGPERTMIRIQDVAMGTQREFVVTSWKSSEAVYRLPFWSADGTRLLFMSRGPAPQDSTPWAVWSCRLDGTGLERVTPPNLRVADASLSPDGRFLAFRRVNPKESLSRSDLCVMEMRERRVNCLVSGGVKYSPIWSVDGKWLAYRRGDKRAGERLEAISLDGKRHHLLADVGALGRAHPEMLTFGWGVWLPDNRTLWMTMVKRAPRSLEQEIWQVGWEGGAGFVASGSALTTSRDGRTLLLQMGDNYWLTRIAAPVRR